MEGRLICFTSFVISSSVLPYCLCYVMFGKCHVTKPNRNFTMSLILIKWAYSKMQLHRNTINTFAVALSKVYSINRKKGAFQTNS